jgi:hypothetical protein
VIDAAPSIACQRFMEPMRRFCHYTLPGVMLFQYQSIAGKTAIHGPELHEISL